MWKNVLKNLTFDNVRLIFPLKQKAVYEMIQVCKKEPNVRKIIIFGSSVTSACNPWSDIDILVDIDSSAHMGLIQYAGMVNDLERILGRKVDMVAEGTVKPFAQESINHDKVLVYERS